MYALFTRPLCKSRLFLLSEFSGVNENFVNMKLGVRFGVFVVCGLVNFNVFLSNCTPKIDQIVHSVSYLLNFHSLLETLDHNNSRLLRSGHVNKAYSFVISCVLMEQTFSWLLLVS